MPFDDNGQWQPNIFGKQYKVFNSRARALLVAGPRKAAKCLSGETIVWTGSGLSRIRRMGPQIKPGDYVLHAQPVVSFDSATRSFEIGETRGFYRDKETHGLQFKLLGGFEISTSVVHPLWSFADGLEDYRTAGDIMARISRQEEVFLPIVMGHHSWSTTRYVRLAFLPMDRKSRKRFERNKAIRRAMAVVGMKRIYDIAKFSDTTYHTVRAFLKKPNDVGHYDLTLDEDMGYLIGALIGDGCLTTKQMRKNRILFSTLDSEVIHALNSAMRKHFQSEFHNRTGCDWETTSPGLRGMADHIRIVGYAHEKRVPDCIIESPKSVVRAFLRGLFDTDGTSDKMGRVSYSSSSKPLALEVQQLLLAFGVMSTLSTKKTTHRDSHKVELNGASRRFYEEIGFGLSRKQSRSELMPKRTTNLHNKFPFSAETLSQEQKDTLSMGGRVMWRKVMSCQDCKVDLYDISVPRFHSFVGNGVINHNTWIVLHKIIRHMWETPSARVAMFSRTLKNSKEGGTWSDLHTITLPEWIRSGVGLQYTTLTSEGKPGPKVDGQTRTPYFKIRNAWGGESELMLFSLDYDHDIEDKLKEQRFSMIYFSELSKFRDRKILSVALLSLRMPHLTMDQQMWIADTNPSEDGDDSWIYEVWYIEKNLSYEDYCARNKEKGRPSMDESGFTNYKAGLELIEMTPEENIYLDPRELEELKSTYAYDEGLYARYVKGLWVYGDGDASIHFKGKFQDRHVVGNTDAAAEDDWMVANPSPTCHELITGWDLGDVNHAQVTLEKDVSTGRACFVILDELESIGEEIDNTTFTEAAMSQIERLEDTAGRKFNLERAWSDRSSIERFSATGGTFPYLEVHAASGYRIFLMGVPKPKDSVRARVSLLKTLLIHDRIRVSAHCKAVIRMFKHLKKGSSALDYVVRDENKHIFDALTYALLMECAEELEDLKALGIGNIGKRVGGLAVSIG